MLFRSRRMEKGDLFIVDASHEHLMRGFDYRCKDGIALLLCCGFDSEEDLHQALGRVGRYGDACVRLVDKELGEENLRDESKRVEVAQQISAIIQAVRAEKEAAASAEKAAADLKQRQDAAAAKAARSARALQARYGLAMGELGPVDVQLAEQHALKSVLEAAKGRADGRLKNNWK